MLKGSDPSAVGHPQSLSSSSALDGERLCLYWASSFCSLRFALSRPHTCPSIVPPPLFCRSCLAFTSFIDASISPLMCSGRVMLCHESPLKQHSVNFLQCCAIPMLQCERTRHWHLPSVRPLMVPGSYRSFSHLLCSLAAWFVWVHARGSASSESHLRLIACALIPCP